MLEYRMVFESDFEDFMREVNAALMGGGTLQCGVCVEYDGEQTWYYQAYTETLSIKELKLLVEKEN